jgi:hypothetical protein
MVAIALPTRQARQQPQNGTPRLDLDNPVTQGVVWVSGTNSTTFGPNGNLRDVVSNRLATINDANNYFAKSYHPLGVISTRVIGSADNGVTYNGPVGLLHGATEFTLVSTFIFRSGSISAQWLNFRVDNQHSLDVFSQTSNSITFGCDWAGAWNGTSQQTLSGLNDGDVVTICASVNQSGARFFANGKFIGTKSGSGFTISTAASATSIVWGIRTDYVQGMVIKRALSDSAAISLTKNPWQVYSADPDRRFLAIAGATSSSIISASGSCTSTAIAAAIARALWPITGSSQGTATLSSAVNAISKSDGSSSGSSAISSVVRAIWNSSGDSSSTSVVTSTSNSVYGTTGSSSSISSVAASTQSIWVVVGSVNGSSTVNGVTVSGTTTISADGSSSGLSSVQAIVNAITQSLGSVSGSSSAQAIVNSVIPSNGTSLGVGAAQSNTNSVNQSTGNGVGFSNVNASSVAIQITVANSNGSASVESVTQAIKGVVASAIGASTTSATSSGGIQYIKIGDKLSITIITDEYAVSVLDNLYSSTLLN